MSLVPTPLSTADHEFIAAAVEYLERPSLLMRLASLVGKPAETLLAVLPDRAGTLVADASAQALTTALDWAVRSISDREPGAAPLPREQQSRRSAHLHTAVTATTGAVGGFFGLAALPLELPATTIVMLRSIARIAAQQGADLRDPQVRLQCLAVFSFGAPQIDTMESAYFTGRLGLALAVRDAATFVGQHTAREVSEAVAKGTAPMLVRLVNQIAARFQVVVSEKVLAQSVPLVGAASGALVNAAFSDHFNTVARFHFGIVALERKHGKEVVETAYRETQQALLGKSVGRR